MNLPPSPLSCHSYTKDYLSPLLLSHLPISPACLSSPFTCPPPHHHYPHCPHPLCLHPPEQGPLLLSQLLVQNHLSGHGYGTCHHQMERAYSFSHLSGIWPVPEVVVSCFHLPPAGCLGQLDGPLPCTVSPYLHKECSVPACQFKSLFSFYRSLWKICFHMA